MQTLRCSVVTPFPSSLQVVTSLDSHGGMLYAAPPPSYTERSFHSLFLAGMTQDSDAQRLSFVIDGLNVAYAHGDHRHASVAGIVQCVNYWVRTQVKLSEIVVVLPRRFPLDASWSTVFRGIHVIQPFTNEHGDNDRVAIQYAFERDAYVVTNDQFRDHRSSLESLDGRRASRRMKSWISFRVIRFRWEGDTFLPALEMAMVVQRHYAPEREATTRSYFCCRMCSARIAPVSAAFMNRDPSGIFRRDVGTNQVGIEFRVRRILPWSKTLWKHLTDVHQNWTIHGMTVTRGRTSDALLANVQTDGDTFGLMPCRRWHFNFHLHPYIQHRGTTRSGSLVFPTLRSLL